MNFSCPSSATQFTQYDEEGNTQRVPMTQYDEEGNTQRDPAMDDSPAGSPSQRDRSRSHSGSAQFMLTFSIC